MLDQKKIFMDNNDKIIISRDFPAEVLSFTLQALSLSVWPGLWASEAAVIIT